MIKKLIILYLLKKKLNKQIIFHQEDSRFSTNEFFISVLKLKNIKRSINSKMELFNIENNLYDYKIYDYVYSYRVIIKQPDCDCGDAKKYNYLFDVNL